MNAGYKMSNYYNENSKAFIDDTFTCDMSSQYNFFEQYLNNAKTILDLGFGSGRDSLYFQNKDYEVYSIDPTLEFCNNAKKMGLKHVYQMTAQKMNFKDLFDGIWACASLLHVSSNELNDTFKKCSNALKENGIMYASFKYGIFEGERHGRYFLDLNEESIKKHLKGTNLSIIDMLVTEDVRKDKETKWLNIIFKKVKI